jgi:hypothetical protein
MPSTAAPRAAHRAGAYSPLTLRETTVSVVVDVEEEFDWTKPFSSQSQSVDAAAWINLGHTLMRSFDLVPAYLVTYPIARSPEASALFRQMLEDGGCEIGAQLHPWVNPPLEEEITARHSYPSNLPAELERRKLISLVAAIEEGVGVRPRIYKAGRYGLDLERVQMLVELGFLVDTSVMPYHDFSEHDGGPDFFGLPSAPFWLDRENRLLELPATQGIVGGLSGRLSARVLKHIYSQRLMRMRVPGVLARLGLVERIRLSPEGQSFESSRRLIDAACRQGHANFVLSFHSPSLQPGSTPYVRDQRQLNEFLENIYNTLRHLRTVVGAKPVSVLDLHARLAEPSPA